jgi:hypothetical protein
MRTHDYTAPFTQAAGRSPRVARGRKMTKETLFDAAQVKPNRKVWNSSTTSVRSEGRDHLQWVMDLFTEG